MWRQHAEVATQVAVAQIVESVQYLQLAVVDLEMRRGAVEAVTAGWALHWEAAGRVLLLTLVAGPWAGGVILALQLHLRQPLQPGPQVRETAIVAWLVDEDEVAAVEVQAMWCRQVDVQARGEEQGMQVDEVIAQVVELARQDPMLAQRCAARVSLEAVARTVVCSLSQRAALGVGWPPVGLQRETAPLVLTEVAVVVVVVVAAAVAAAAAAAAVMVWGDRQAAVVLVMIEVLETRKGDAKALVQRVLVGQQAAGDCVRDEAVEVRPPWARQLLATQ